MHGLYMHSVEAFTHTTILEHLTYKVILNQSTPFTIEKRMILHMGRFMFSSVKFVLSIHPILEVTKFTLKILVPLDTSQGL